MHDDDAPRSDAPSSWPTLEVHPVGRYQVFEVERVRRRSPRTGRVGTFEVLHMPDWVNVIPLTAEHEVVLVEQYRHGVDRNTLEIPGGLVDLGEPTADAAARELREETGYAGGPPERLGRVLPNPAIQTNACDTWLIRDARPEGPADPDEGEDIVVRTAPLDEIPELIRTGRIEHALVVAAFHHLELARRSGDVVL